MSGTLRRVESGRGFPMVPAMTAPKWSHRSIRRGFPVITLAALLGLGACGGGTDDTTSEPEIQPAPDDTDTAGDTSPDSEAASAEDFPDPVAVLPFEIEVPSGFRMLPAECDLDDSDDETADDDDSGDGSDYSTWITYAVPETWTTVGRGSAGSGSVTGSDQDLSFRTGDGGARLNIAVEWDNRDLDGNITDFDGEPWESFDYDSRIGDDETTITYEQVTTLKVGDQQAELYHLDPTQAPDHVSTTQYKVRLEAFELPSRASGGDHELAPESFVVTVELDQDDAALDQATIEAVVESFVLPECSWDKVLSDRELMLNLDLNRDGHIRNAEDVREEIEEMQEGLEDQLDELKNGSSGG